MYISELYKAVQNLIEHIQKTSHGNRLLVVTVKYHILKAIINQANFTITDNSCSLVVLLAFPI